MARVLVIDDSPLARSSLRYALEDAGFEVTDAPDGATSLQELTSATPPDVVVCDIDMPGMSGIEVVKEFRSRLPLTPVLMHTAHGDAPLIVNAMREGAFGYLLKGLSDEVLVQEIHAAVNHRRVLEHNQKLADANRAYQQNLERLAEERAAQIIQLQSQKAHAEKLAALGTVVAGVAHEVNNPLAVIKSGLHWLDTALVPVMRDLEQVLSRAAETSPEWARMIEDLRDRIGWGETAELPEVLKESSSSVERIARIVRNIRRTVHPSGSHVQTDLARVLEQVEVLCRAELDGRAELAIVSTCDADCKVPLGEDDLVTVLSNLVVNAAHAVEAGQGRIELAAKVDPSQLLELSVSDNGCGIAKENLSRVCDPFFTTKAPGKGTGLGLSLASQIVQAARGELKIDSELGKGTSVILRIPLRPPSAPVVAA